MRHMPMGEILWANNSMVEALDPSKLLSSDVVVDPIHTCNE